MTRSKNGIHLNQSEIYLMSVKKMELNELRMLQALPLEVKVRKSKQRIKEWIDYYGPESVYLAYSGGVGSTVLYFLLKEVEIELGIEPRIPALFVNTRNENPDLIRHVYALKGQNNKKFRKIMKTVYDDIRNRGDTIEIRLSKQKQQDVIKKYGHLVVSKKVSRNISDVQRLKVKYPDTYKNDPRYHKKLDIKNRFSVPKKYQYLIDAPFKISNACCRVLKHSVFETYERETGRYYAMTGVQASESMDRKINYLKNGCNGFGMKKPISNPLGFWRQTDILEYLKKYNIPYPSCYGDIIISSDGTYKTTREQRTGCMCCLAGVNLEKGENRIQRMQKDYPKHYDYLMRPIKENGLGAKEVLDFIGIRSVAREELSLEDLINLYC